MAATNIVIHAELREITIYCYLRHFKVFEIDPHIESVNATIASFLPSISG